MSCDTFQQHDLTSSTAQQHLWARARTSSAPALEARATCLTLGLCLLPLQRASSSGDEGDGVSAAVTRVRARQGRRGLAYVGQTTQVVPVLVGLGLGTGLVRAPGSRRRTP